ncbi:MAG: hypothetical protein JNM27_20095 [Leptospirales bacterium]|nr:hypothetical protein [Leptospirales bacterium]
MLRSLCLLVLLLLAGSLAAENVYLRDGRVISGRISNQTRTDITIETAQGTMKINKDQIRRIQYDTQVDDKAKEEARKAEEKRRLEEYNRQQAEQRRQNEERMKQEEAKRLEAEKKNQDEAKRLADQKKLEEDKKKADADKKRRDDESKMKPAGPFWYGAMVRSMVLPGWGQYYQGRNRAAFLNGGLTLGLGIFSLYEEGHYHRNRNNYSSTSTTFLLGTPFVARNYFNVSQTDGQAYFWFLKGYGQTSSARIRMETHAQRLRVARTAFLLAYAWNVVDVVLFNPTTTTKVGLQTGPGNYRLAFAMTF